MIKKNNKVFILLLILTSCVTIKKGFAQSSKPDFKVKVESLDLFDKSRNRSVPVALYLPVTDKKINRQKLIIFSHGYGENKGGDNLAYSYLTEYLASKGYFVASIQHELPTDDLLPTSGIIQTVRRPFWDRGADNILFVLNELKKSHLTLDYQSVTLIGHSNGGDMTALFPQKYPSLVEKIITMDNRRMALPRTKQPEVYTLRSSDLPADEGVLPAVEEQKKFGITVIMLNNTKHSEMDNDANEDQRKEINDYIIGFLKN